jgi:type IV secretory pathway protease TraF
MHVENIKTVANLTNNKDVFLCIIRFHAQAGYLQTYETLLKEINAHPASEEVEYGLCIYCHVLVYTLMNV